MRKVVFCFLALLLILGPAIAQTGASATIVQTGTSASIMLQEEKQKFLRNLKTVAIDSAIVYPLARYFDAEVNAIYTFIAATDIPFLPASEKEKAVRSLVYFITQYNNNIKQQKVDVYDIPGSLQSYKEVVDAMLHHKPVVKILEPLQPRRTQLLAAAFSQYKEAPLMDDIAVYKRIASSPQFILEFLENKPEFRFADSLILKAASENPTKFIFYTNKGNGPLQTKIRNTNNIYVQKIISLSGNKNIAELLPFVMQLAENKITEEEIVAKRMDVIQYFQTMVNDLQAYRASVDSSSIFLKLLRDGIKQKALSFYVEQINELHASADAVRFVSVKNLRPEDLYYVMTSCGEELYTSSYLGLYKRLMENFKGGFADSLFTIVNYDNFHVFLRLTANYNVAVDFLGNMSNRGEILHRFIGGIETNVNSGLDRAMDIADFFAGLDSTSEINGLIQTELQSNLNRCTSSQKYLGVRLYSVLLEVFGLVKQKGMTNKLWAKLGNYEVLKSAALQNKNKEVVELVLFYGDEDGTASFSNFSKLYADSSKWTSSRTNNFITIHSVANPQISIYANYPLDAELEMDLRAQDTLVAFMKEQSLEPTVLIHRGHSYHLDKTIKRLQPSVKLAILGSCGSYNKSISIASINQDIQVIGSKKTGSKSINDPLIDEINSTLLENRDLVWDEIWSKLNTRFSKDEFTLSLFKEYFSPDNNLSLFVLKLFSF